MKKFFTVVSIMYVCVAQAAGGGVVIKGVLRSWDEIARMALKVSGKELTDDAVKGAAKTLEYATKNYGDDVAEASLKGGIEVVEQTTKYGRPFVNVLKLANKYSDDAVRRLVINGADVVKYSAKYADEVVRLNTKVPGIVPRTIDVIENSGVDNVRSVINAVSNLPKEDITRVIGAVEKNKSVAREFLEHVEKGGKYFVDKIFKLNAKQIIAGGLTYSMIIAADKITDPLKAMGDTIRKNTENAWAEISKSSNKTEIARGVVTTSGNMVKNIGNGFVFSMVFLSIAIGVAIIIFVMRKTSRKKC
jgi:hypothetical protein